MTEYLAPGVYIEEVPFKSHPIDGVPTSTAAFIDIFAQGPIGKAARIDSYADFERVFGGLHAGSEASYAIQQYYLNGGRVAWVVRVDDPCAEKLVGDAAAKTGMYALDGIAPDSFNTLCIPAAAKLDQHGFATVIAAAEKYCGDKRTFLIIDPPFTIKTKAEIVSWMQSKDGLRDLRHHNAAIYFPRIEIPDPLNGNQPRNVGASGTLAGIYARTDQTRGVWKAPAGAEADLRGATVPIQLNNHDNDELNKLGINALRTFPQIGNVAWGARTLAGSDASEWRYVPVRRLALYLEQSLYRGLQWAVFEPNDELLWAQVRASCGSFMNGLFRQGAFQGTKPGDAFFIKCDETTTSKADIESGVLNIIVGFAPLKPAEFVLIRIQQLAGCK
ncbi:MAG TPA: phage tail sheath C-terminal domain-containing protein [Pyrinomonadaceae bacterium]|nr:phage tail sheath C-terminal domain-containing protein [Pyrinomonadaceae bacterium]